MSNKSLLVVLISFVCFSKHGYADKDFLDSKLDQYLANNIAVSPGLYLTGSKDDVTTGFEFSLLVHKLEPIQYAGGWLAFAGMSYGQAFDRSSSYAEGEIGFGWLPFFSSFFGSGFEFSGQGRRSLMSFGIQPLLFPGFLYVRSSGKSEVQYGVLFKYPISFGGKLLGSRF